MTLVICHTSNVTHVSLSPVEVALCHKENGEREKEREMDDGTYLFLSSPVRLIFYFYQQGESILVKKCISTLPGTKVESDHSDSDSDSIASHCIGSLETLIRISNLLKMLTQIN